MALVNANRDFEDGDTATAKADTAKVEAAAKPASEVAVKQSTAVAAASAVVSPFDAIRNAYTVDYNTLKALGATQGAFVDKETEAPLGAAITLQLMSHQASYVISPGTDSDEDAKLVKYSSDGHTTKDGEDCVTYLRKLREGGFPGAKMSQRVILVGALIDSGSLPELKETLVQIDLAPSSKTMFDRYSIQAAFDVSRGKATAEQAQMLRMTTRIAKNGKNTYTVVDFKMAA